MRLSAFSLEGKVAIVTGGGTGIGRSIALQFAEAGADVVVGSRTLATLEKVAEEVKALGKHSLAVPVDITKKPDIDSLVQKVMDEFGAIDILVNNAGKFLGERLIDTPEEHWDEIMNVDLKGHYLCSQAVARIMIAQKSGKIINIASDLGIRVTQDGGAYCIAKAGILMLTKVLARELAPYNIRVNTILPGLIRTPMSEGTWSNPERLKWWEDATLLGRIGEPGEIASAALFLASDASSYTTGHTIFVEGGMLD